MGIAFACPGDDAFDESIEALIMRTISLKGDNEKSPLRSFSYNGRETEPAIFKGFGSGKLIIEGSLSFNSRESDPFHLETKISIKSPTSETEKSSHSAGSKKSRFCQLQERDELAMQEQASPKHEAALKLQKVYKSFRTRRLLADCAVLVEQRWWKLLDFALLKRSSISFFDIEKPESAVSRWSRARTRAAKVGKGLSKDEKAQKLALQHWLEAIDPRHRYGHNLHFYYDSWLSCESKQPFFYWLDVGEGKEVNIENQCPRSKLQQQCIKYLGPKERVAYEVIVEDGKFLYKQSRQILDTSEGPKDIKWIFVLSTSKTLYVGQKKKGTFQHSSFLAGGATSAAGRLVVENGVLKAVWPHSGHYRPTEENFQEFMSFLQERDVDLTNVQKSPTEDDEESASRLRSNSTITSNLSELYLIKRNISEKRNAEVHSTDRTTNALPIQASAGPFGTSDKVNSGSTTADSRLSSYKKLRISVDFEQHQKPEEHKIVEDIKECEQQAEGETGCLPELKNTEPFKMFKDPTSASSDEQMEVSSASENPLMFCKKNLFAEEQEEDNEVCVPPELILRRIHSKKVMKSYQLGKQLSFKWTTGAGPRIGCVRDYPSELQFRALEQVNLSPRETGGSKYPSPRSFTSPAGPKLAGNIFSQGGAAKANATT